MSQRSSADASEGTKKPRRSRFGCVRCRERRQKCDEQRPNCKRCVESGAACSYVVNLRWGGRNFGRSRFGEVMNNGVHRVESQSGEHVYALETPDDDQIIKEEAPAESSTAVALVTSHQQKPELFESIDPTSWMTASQKSLLNHFMVSASQITSCHPLLQDEYCKTLLPMAVKTPSLLSAIMALSQTHKEAGIDTPTSDGQMSLVQSFRGTSIQSLTKDLAVFDVRTAEASLATILTLCLCEIHAGSYESKSWRVHFDGARAVLTAISRSSGSKTKARGSTFEFLERWYVSIEALAALTAKGLPTGQLKGSDGIDPIVESVDGIFIDDYLGFSTDLIPIFREIGAAAWERRRRDSGSPQASRVPESQFEEDMELLEEAIQNMIARDEAYPPNFYPGVQDRLSAKQIEDFSLCSRTYQHTALIHLYRRIKKLPRSSIKVQASVKAILDCSSRITLAPGLSPWIVLATPIFTAGCEALNEDRFVVMTLFQQLYESLRIRNMQRGLEVLQEHWRRVDETGSEDWNASQDDEVMDFIPY